MILVGSPEERGIEESLYILDRLDDASRLDPVYKQPMWDDASGLVQHRPSCSFIMRTRRWIFRCSNGGAVRYCYMDTCACKYLGGTGIIV